MGICGNRWRSAQTFLDRLPEDPSRPPRAERPEEYVDSNSQFPPMPVEATTRKSAFLKTEILTSAGEPGSLKASFGRPALVADAEIVKTTEYKSTSWSRGTQPWPRRLGLWLAQVLRDLWKSSVDPVG